MPRERLIKFILPAAALNLMFSVYAQAAFASCGTFEVSKGDVKVQPASGAPAQAVVGSKICSGETVIAGESARAKIKMEDGNELNISPNSKIVIEQYQYDVASNKKKVLLNVLKGKVRATTREENMYTDKARDGQANTFQVRTKSAVAGVRGTDFLTSYDPSTKKMEVVTFRGKVEVGMAGPNGSLVNSVQVAVGQKTEVVGGAKAPAVPHAVPANELMKQNNESRNESAPSAASPGASANRGENGDAKQPGKESGKEPAKETGKEPGKEPAKEPARESGKEPAKESGSSPAASTGSNAAGPASTTQNSSGTAAGGPRTPASAIGGSLVTNAELPSFSGADALSGVKLPTNTEAPRFPAAVIPTAVLNNPIVNNAISNKKANVSIILHVQ